MLTFPPQMIDKKFFRYLLKLEGQKAIRYLNFFSLLIVQMDTENSEKGSSFDCKESSLKVLESLIREEIRETDLIGKPNMEKFYLILHQTDSTGSFQIADRIRNRVKNYTFIVDEKERKQTICVGATSFPSHANDIDSLIAKAGHMLEKAQTDGGDRVYLPLPLGQ